MLPRIYRSFPGEWDTFFSSDLLHDFFNHDGYKNVPAVNIVENDDEFVIEVAAPGLEKKDFKIDLENNTLTISSEKEDKTEEKNERSIRKEFRYSSFCRTFTLPETVENDKIKAKHKDGILSVSIPKKEIAKIKPAHQIAIA
jgi:HSP20 family protein